MNHLSFNHSTPDPTKAPQPLLQDHADQAETDCLGLPVPGFYAGGVNKGQFHAHSMQDRTEFQCDRCGGIVVRMPGRAGTSQPPYVMYCNACDLASGGWLTKQERERSLEQMPVG